MVAIETQQLIYLYSKSIINKDVKKLTNLITKYLLFEQGHCIIVLKFCQCLYVTNKMLIKNDLW